MGQNYLEAYEENGGTNNLVTILQELLGSFHTYRIVMVINVITVQRKKKKTTLKEIIATSSQTTKQKKHKQ